MSTDAEIHLNPGQPASGLPATTPTLAHAADGLPAYTQSLLRIKLPVNVTLATKKQPINTILELGIGSIIHFNKPCDEPLDLEVNGRKIAHGEAVKVGDKFGIRVRVVSLPDERFQPLGTP